MKATLEIADGLLEEAREVAEREQLTLGELMEAALRRELAARAKPPGKRFKLRDARAGSGGMAPEFVEGGWEAMRDEIYRAHGA